ncbi:MAG: mannitol 2-dehydrogenase [Abditibacteriota bacterium]|nr:mannitol 2-dehydrogenase [Abditibacteriota bacterium]
MAIKLSQANLALLSPLVQIPRYDRRHIGQGIVHIGVGGFHRAHQTVYTEELFKRGQDLQWGFCGAGLLPHDARMRDVLRSQDCLYTLVERDTHGDSARVVGSITEFLFAPDEREAVIEKMAAPATRIVSMTITEGGYYVQGSSGKFDAQHPDIQHDLAHPKVPQGSFGFLLEALDRRRKRGQAPFTLLSCDNIQGNGNVLQTMLLAFAELRDPTLANWMATNCLFPNSMVDRITPATTDEHRALVRDTFSIDDGWPVMTETFKQWVIEDQFVQGRPAWETVGAQLTDNVLPYEKMKLRLLNASHQALCYIGMLFGYEFAHQTMEDAQIRALVQHMMDHEVTPILPPVPGINLEEYKATLIERFANPAIRDQLSRIGIYGSSGIPKFVLPTIEEALKSGGSITLLSFTIACWFRYLNGRDEAGNEIQMKDPAAPRLRQIAVAAGSDPTPLLAVREIFSEELARSPQFVQQVREFLHSFYDQGARATLAEVLRRCT